MQKIKNSHYLKACTVLCVLAALISGCSGRVAEEKKDQAPVKIKIDQPPAPEILNTQKGLPDNIFDARLESKRLTAAEFTRLYGDALQAALPQSKVSVTAPLNLAVRVAATDQHDCKVDLTKLWQACKDKPGSREDLATPKVQAFYGMVKFINQPLAGEEYADKLVPLVRGEKLIQAITGNGTDKTGLYYDKIFGDLYCVYAVDDQQEIKPVREDYLTNYAKVKKEELKTISLRNLQRIVADKITLRADGPISIVSVGGVYEPSLILLDKVVRHLAAHVKGRLIVAVPTRDSLFICGDETPTALTKLQEATSRAFAKTKLPISDKLYVLDQGQWKVFRAFDS